MSDTLNLVTLNENNKIPASQIEGSLANLESAEISANEALEWGHAYEANAEGGNLTLKLPAATGNGGSLLYVEVGPKSGAHTVTLEAHGTEKIQYEGEEVSTLVLSLEPAQALMGLMLIAIASNPRVF